MNGLKLQLRGDKILITVKVVPGSSRTALAGVLDGMLKVKIAAAPEKGNANKELIKFIAGELGLKKRDISIISGQTNPVKLLEIAGSDAGKVKGLAF
ncbi:hypothetical protein SMSP2_02373 [Limihaloglobus sulfuriphilus]|uniref:UPF0235 protein SMSP2_02373 n=1 Tax=Limihaloglobus sulfuriphilus TaxID=1851148 RepID=A0A1Q2MH66_9BACT|nr:DUF167 domain-containing protein [Limihaloglobus sulfuriphilus]AQQ71994.1 hypothetical protein SMSP2_02373 [Limihaloglobus sulfuriphilus]